ncbi:MAG: DUF4907 domain-containing protein [Ferruginibacter sp.]
MQKKLTIIKYSTISFFLVFAGCSPGQKKEEQTVAAATAYKVFVVQKNFADTSWGYVIEHNNHVLIRQFSVPALKGNFPFKNRQQAALIGEFVAGKLNHGQRPAVTKNELDSLNILTTADDNL